jgi:hypothetical protein
MMFTGVPNLVWVFTFPRQLDLRVDLVADSPCAGCPAHEGNWR